MNQHQRIFQHGFHAVWVCHEVRAEITTIELHAFHDLEFGLHRLGFFNGDDAILADFVHGFGNQFADGAIAVRGNRANLGDGVALDGLRHIFDFFNHAFGRLLNSALKGHRIRAGRNCFQAFPKNRLRQNGRRRGAVTGHVGSL